MIKYKKFDLISYNLLDNPVSYSLLIDSKRWSNIRSLIISKLNK